MADRECESPPPWRQKPAMLLIKFQPWIWTHDANVIMHICVLWLLVGLCCACDVPVVIICCRRGDDKRGNNVIQSNAKSNAAPLRGDLLSSWLRAFSTPTYSHLRWCGHSDNIVVGGEITQGTEVLKMYTLKVLFGQTDNEKVRIGRQLYVKARQGYLMFFSGECNKWKQCK